MKRSGGKPSFVSLFVHFSWFLESSTIGSIEFRFGSYSQNFSDIEQSERIHTGRKRKIGRSLVSDFSLVRQDNSQLEIFKP